MPSARPMAWLSRCLLQRDGLVMMSAIMAHFFLILNKVLTYPSSFFPLPFFLQVEDLRQAVIRAVHNSDSESERSTPEEKADVSLRSQVEDLAYEDWAVDLSDVSASFNTFLNSSSLSSFLGCLC